MYGCCKNDKVRSFCGPVLTLTHCIYCIVNGQGIQIKNQLVQLVLCMLNKLLAHNLPPYSAPFNCSIVCSGSRPL